jgi:hypothetical protein
MSGGHFNYVQFRFDEVAHEIGELIETEKGYDKDIINEFKKAIYFIKLSSIYVQRIDWLICCDDGPESFKERLFNDIALLNLGEE